MAMLIEAHTRVNAGLLTAARYAELETVLGLNRNEHGLLASDRLGEIMNAIEAVTYDWVHNMLQDGVFSVETRAFLNSAEIDRATIKAFLEDTEWCFPKSRNIKSKQLHRIFDDRRASSKDPDKIKASCSELLGVYGLLRHFFERTHATPETLPMRRSFFAVCDMLDLILSAKFKLVEAGDVWMRLEAATVTFLTLHKLAYGARWLKPKHHWQLDVPRQIFRDGLVLDAFVIERTHLAVKAVADPIRNTERFEASVMASLSTAVWNRALEPFQGGLLGPQAPLPGGYGVVVADRIEVYSVEFAVGDVVCKGDATGCIRACCCHHDELVAFVDVFALVERFSDHSRVCRPTGRLAAWAATELHLALAWRSHGGGTVLVLLQ